jgi:hypothetical protein
MYLKPLQKYCQQLEQENETLRTDPNSILGQVITEARKLHLANSRLSVLAAILLKRANNSALVSVEEMKAFESLRINIKWDMPEGVTKPEDATEYIFSYEAVPASDPAPFVATEEVPDEAPACTEPGCNLPKDLRHTHTTPVVVPVEETQTAQAEAQ